MKEPHLIRSARVCVVVRAGGGFGGYSDRAVDLRVDDDPAPISKLAHLLALHRQTFGS